MKIYVAGPFQQFERVRSLQRKLIDLGHEISHDWTLEHDNWPNGLAPGSREAILCAMADMQGVKEAEAVIVLTPEDKCVGCGLWIEMGAALALCKLVAVVGPQRERSVFAELAARLEQDDDCIAWINSMKSE